MRRGRFRHTLRAVPGFLLTLALLAAAPDSPASKSNQAQLEDVTLAAPPFEAAQKMPKKDVTYFSDHFAQRLTANGVQVITTEKITSVREMEKLRQLAGCPATSADCIIELGHMLGAVGVLRGTIAKVGELYQVDVRVYQSSDGKVIAARSASARSSEGLVRALDQLATETAAAVKATFAPAKPQEKPPLLMPPPPPLVQKSPAAPRPLDLRAAAWIPATAGIVAGVGSLGCFGVSQYMRHQIATGEPNNIDDANRLADQGQILGWVGTGLAAAAGIAGGTWALFAFTGPRSSVTVTPAPAGVKVEVKFP